MLGLIGIVIAAMSSELNDQVASVALPDIRGGFAISNDSGTWFESLYVSAEIVGAGISPWFLVTLSLRRWALFVVALCGTATVLLPFCPNEAALDALRLLQGFGGGMAIPMLLTAALRVLTPATRLYGLAIYSVTATFTPAIATSPAALWTDLVGWRWVFWEAIPLCTLASTLIWAGIPPEKPQYARFRIFDWCGVVLLTLGFGALSTMLYQGDRFDWFNSSFISVLALVSAVCIPAFLVNEWFHELPLMKLQLLLRPNFAYGAICLITFLVVGGSDSTIPARFLSRVQGFRPEQFAGLTGLVAAAQIVMLPAIAWVLDHEWIDARLGNLLGLLLIVCAYAGASFATANWYPGQFLFWQALQAAGQPMIVMSLLMMATNTLTKPEEGPFASALVNVPRGIAEALAAWLLDLITRWRGGLHYSRIVDQLGQAGVYFPSARSAGSAVEQQVNVLTLSDAYILFAAITLGLIAVLLLLAQRTPPPRILLAKH